MYRFHPLDDTHLLNIQHILSIMRLRFPAFPAFLLRFPAFFLRFLRFLRFSCVFPAFLVLVNSKHDPLQEVTVVSTTRLLEHH